MSAGSALGVFGGTFDPIHIGHLAAAQDAAIELGLDRVLFVPNRTPPHKRDERVSAAEDRLRMVELAIEDNPLFEVSTIELERTGPSYTLDTLRHLRETIGTGTRLIFLTGTDALAGLSTWHEPRALLEEFEIVLLDRLMGQGIDWQAAEELFPGIRRRIEVVCVAQLEISSSDLRRRVREGLPIRYYVLPAIERYIATKGLYLDNGDPPQSV